MLAQRSLLLILICQLWCTLADAQPPTKGNTEADAKVEGETIVGTLKWRGKPLSGVTIRAFRGSQLLDEQFRTDEQGEFRVPRSWGETDRFLCVVAGGNNCIGWFDFYVHERADKGGQRPSTGAFTMTYLSKRRIRGRLVNESDEPLAGISVRIDTLNHPANLLSTHWHERMVDGKRILAEALTDGDGWFELGVARESSATVRVVHSDWINTRIPVPLDTTDLGVTKLAAAAKVSGRVVDGRSGQPLSGARVSAQTIETETNGGWGTTLTDQDGNYTIGGLAAGRFNILLDDATDRSLTAPAHANVLLAAGETFSASFTVNTGRRLAGRVLNVGTGEPLAGCTVSYYGPARPRSGGATLTTTTNDDGDFEFYVPPGASHVYVSDEREAVNESARDVEVPTDGDPEPVVLKAGPKTKESRIRILLDDPPPR